MKVGDLFKRTKDSEGLPTGYELKDHHKRGYSSVIRHVKRRVIIDENGHKHGKLSIETFGSPIKEYHTDGEYLRRSLARNQQEYYGLIAAAKGVLPDELIESYMR